MTTRRSNGEGYARKRADGRWELQIGVGGDRKSLYGKTRAEVLKKRKQLELTPRAFTAETLDDLARVWLANVVEPQREKTTLRTYRSYLTTRILPALGAKKLGDIRPADVERWVADLRGTAIKPGSITTAMKILRTLLNYGVKTERLARNPAALVEVAAGVSREVPTPSPEQLRALVDTLQADTYGPVFMAMLMLGLRRGEALGLTWGDLDMVAGIVHVRRQLKRLPHEGYVLDDVKTKLSRRDLHLSSQMHTIFMQVEHDQNLARMQYYPLYREKYDNWHLVFRTPQGRPLCPAHTLYRLGKAVRAAGLPHVRLHDLRHYYASILFAQGVDPKVVQEQMGHSSLGLTMDVYTHLIPKVKRDASDRAWGYLEGE